MSALGCKDFAILFDDIDTDLLPVDAKEFPSFAHAQVAIANDIYKHLNRPEIFLFCPTGKFMCIVTVQCVFMTFGVTIT